MLEELKALLGNAVGNYTEAQIKLALKMATAEIEGYCKRTLDTELEAVVLQVAKIKLNRIDTEGLASTTYSGISESYIDGYPDEIKTVLTRKRKMKVI